MSITLNDCLRLPTMSDAKVVAGNGGLNKEVLGISVLETSKIIENSNSYTSFGGELIVTGFITCHDDVESMLRCIRAFSNSGDAGLIIFYLGIYLKEIPKEVYELANKLEFPIIVMPKDKHTIPYSYVIYEVMELIIQNKLEANGFNKDNYEIDAEFVQSVLDKDRMSLHRMSFFIKDTPEDICALRFIKIEESLTDRVILLNRIREFYRNNNIKSYVGIYNNDVVILISKKSVLISDEVEKLYEYIKNLIEDLSIAYINQLKSLGNIVNMYKLCTASIKEAELIFVTKNIFNKADLLFAEQCINIMKVESISIKHYLSIINTMKRKDNNLYETLEKYLMDYNSNLTITSENMFLHKNTIQYRLNKVKELLGNEVFEFPEINQLTTAIAIKRLQNKI